MTFDYSDVERIDYHCETHPNETGTVIILPKNEESMTNTERLRFLSSFLILNFLSRTAIWEVPHDKERISSHEWRKFL